MSTPVFVKSAKRDRIRVKINQTCTGWIAHVEIRDSQGWVVDPEAHRFNTSAEAHAFAHGVLTP